MAPECTQGAIHPRGRQLLAHSPRLWTEIRKVPKFPFQIPAEALWDIFRTEIVVQDRCALSMIENHDLPGSGGFKPRIDEVPDGGEEAWSPYDLFQ